MNEQQVIAYCESMLGRVAFTNKYDLGECVGFFNAYTKAITGVMYFIYGCNWAYQLATNPNNRPDIAEQIAGNAGMQIGDCAVWDERIGRGGHVAVYAGGLDFYMQNWGKRKVTRQTVTQQAFDIIVGYIRIKTISHTAAPIVAEPKTYTVQPDDCLSVIGDNLGVNWHKIYEANRELIGDNPDLIYPGQVLVIPE